MTINKNFFEIIKVPPGHFSHIANSFMISCFAYTSLKNISDDDKYGNDCNLHNDVVNWYVDKLHEEPNEPHDSETNGSGQSNLLKL